MFNYSDEYAYDYEDHEDIRKYDRLDLSTQFDELRRETETLALNSIHNVQVPVCSFLRKLSSTDCLKLMKFELDEWSNKNQPSNETMLLNYLVTDYISCGLSSPGFYVEFHKTLKSKIKLLSDLITIWNCLLKSYKITSLNVAFIKQLVFSLNCLFDKMSNLNPEYNISWKWSNLVDTIKHSVKEYELNILYNNAVLTQRNNNSQQNNSLQEKDLGIQNTVPNKSSETKVITSIKTFIDQKSKQKTKDTESLKHEALHSECVKILSQQQNNCEQSANHHQSKKLKLMTDDGENAKPDQILEPQPSEPKLNVFQLMMLNAKKRKANTK